MEALASIIRFSVEWASVRSRKYEMLDPTEPVERGGRIEWGASPAVYVPWKHLVRYEFRKKKKEKVVMCLYIEKMLVHGVCLVLVWTCAVWV